MKPTLEATHSDASFFGHPRGLATLFFTEMWERFSYYGMRALLILFMTASVARGGLGFPVVKAGAIYGFYTAMVYLLSLPGGWVADRIFGQRRAVLYGGILIVAGQFFLMSPGVEGFYAGLGLLMLGTGMLKPNVSTMVGNSMLQATGGAIRASRFTTWASIWARCLRRWPCGWVGERIGWRLGFGLAGLGMVVGLIQYTLWRQVSRIRGTASGAACEPGGGQASETQCGAECGGRRADSGSGWIAGGHGPIGDYRAQVSAALGLVLIIVSVGIFAWLLAGPRLVGDRAQTLGRDSGAVRGVGGVLGGL
jgi:POT family proton-dependent oligopeptide transporter